MHLYQQHWQSDLHGNQRSGFHTWAPKLIMLCLLGIVLLDPALCLLDGHGQPMLSSVVVGSVVGIPATPNPESPSSTPVDARVCQHAHCSILLMIVPPLIIPLARRIPMILPTYRLPFQLAVPPPLPPP